MTDVMKRGDLAPRWQATLYDGPPEAGNEVDLSNANDVKVICWFDGEVLFTRALADGVTRGTGATQGLVTMPWETGDTDHVGELMFEVEVTWPGPMPQTFPADGYLTTRIVQDLG